MLIYSSFFQDAPRVGVSFFVFCEDNVTCSRSFFEDLESELKKPAQKCTGIPVTLRK